MKRIIILILFATIILAIFTSVYADVTLSDVKSNDWFYSNIEEMIRMGIVEGYSDGTFMPDNPVKTNEFIKMVVIAMGYNVELSASTYWADSFIKRSEELKICDTTFISDYSLNLSREQAAKIIANALSLTEVRPLELYNEHVKPIIRDFYLVQDKYRDDVVDCFAWGIMQGDSLKFFNPKNTITRAEAITVILRMIDKTKRIELKLDGVKSIEMQGVVQYPENVLLVAPIYNGVILNEMIDLIEAVKAVENETLGLEKYWLNELGNGWGISGYENLRKYQEYTNFAQGKTADGTGEITYENLVEETDKVAKHWDWTIGVSLIHLGDDWECFLGRRTPYDFDMNFNYKLAEEGTYNSSYEYIMKYHKKTLQAMFKVWFENEYEKAWNIFETALKCTDSHGAQKELTINNRNFFIAYDNEFVGFTVSVKLN